MNVKALPTAALMATLLMAGCASEPEASPGPTLPPPTSVAQAGQRLAAVAQERAAIEARFVERERQCYQKFFVNRCLDEAKDRRRLALAAQRQIEIEAERYQRQAQVDERDRAMAEADAEYRQQEARMATQPAAAPQTSEAPPPRPAPVAERIAKHNAKVKKEQQGAAADAAKRAQNVREYEERKKESEERQAKVKERLEQRRAKEAKAKGTPPASQQQQPVPAGQ